MAEELKIRVTGDTTQARHEFQALGEDAATNIKKLQAAIASVRADKLGADFIGAKEDAEQFKKAIQALNVTLAENKARKMFDDLANDGRGSSKIMKEAFVTASSEIIESWGVDGDIANELGKMFVKLPAGAIAAGVGIVAAFLAAAAAVGTVIVAAGKMIETAEKIGTKSKDDFDEFAKSLKEVGYEVTAVDRALSQELSESVAQVKAATDGLFLILIRESGPELIQLLKNTVRFLNDLGPAAVAFGDNLAIAFVGASAALTTFGSNAAKIAGGFAKLISSNPLTVAQGILDLINVDQAFKDQLVKDFAEIAAIRKKAQEDAGKGFTGFDSNDKGPTAKERAEARERAEEAIFKMRNRFATVNLRDLDAQRAATDEYTKSLEDQIAVLKDTIKFGELQSRTFRELARQGKEAAKEVLDLQYEISELELTTLGSFYDTERIIIAARAKLQRERANDKLKQITDEVAAALWANRQIETDDEAVAAQKLRNIEALNALLEEKQKEHQARIRAINRGEKVDTERATPGSARNALGDAFADEFDSAGKKLSRFATIVAGVKAKVAADLKSLGTTGGQSLQVLGGMVVQLGANMAQAGFAAFISGKSIGESMKQAAAAGIAAIAQLAAVEAVKNLAWGLHAAGLTFIPGYQAAGAAVPNFFASAAAWGSLAAGAGLAAAALSRSGGGTAGGGALGNQLASNSAANNQTTEERIRFTERDGRGVAQGNVIITLVTDQAQTVKNVEMGVLKSYRQKGTVKQVLDNQTGGIPITTAG